jgi:hypothetical protein
VLAGHSEATSAGVGLQAQPMQFSELDGPWQEIPHWARFLIQCGFTWGDEAADRRQITLVSMPCDSAGAGLVALGAMRRRLTLPDANDLRSHFQRIERLAIQGAVQTVLRHEKDRGRFLLRGRDSTGKVWVQHEMSSRAGGPERDGPLRKAIIPELANAWWFEGEAPVQVLEGAELPYGPLYDALIEDAAAIIPANLRRSDSGVCLAGRSAGEIVSRAITAAVRFQIGDRVADLSQLLTVHNWSPGTVSRTAFFNSRTGERDRQVSPPRLVVADGDAAFLKAVDAQDFKNSNVVGVIHRAVERDRLDAIGDKIAALGQWYEHDAALLEQLQSAPRRITMLGLRRRQQ